MEELKRPHIVMITFPVQGRLIPFTTLASRLASLGAVVKFLCPDSRFPKLQEGKSRGSHSGVQFVALRVKDPSSDSGSSSDFLHDTVDSTREVFSKLDLLAERFEEYLNSGDRRPSCLIIDEVCPGISRVAQRSGLPWYIFCPQRGLSLAAALYTPLLESQGKFPINVNDDAISIPGISEKIPPKEFLSYFTAAYPSNLTQVFLESAALSQDSCGILLNTFEELEPEALEALRTEPNLNPNLRPVFTVGPLLPLPDAQPKDGNRSKEEDICMQFLDGQEAGSVVFISFGSIFTFDEQQACSIATALKAVRKPFIWILRDTQPPKDFKRESDGLVMRGWVPQVKILSHPSTGAYLTHCGWNSTLESIAHGVPLVACPQRIDQHLNCKLVTDCMQVGTRLESLNDPTEVEAALRHVIDNREMKKRAEVLRDAAQAAACSASDHLKAFLQLIT